MKKLLLIPALIFFSLATNAQTISPEVAKDLNNALRNSKPDTAQINILLKLAKYHVFKPGENKIDLDSAGSFIKKAESLNAALRSGWASGYIRLIKSYLLKESGQRDKAKEDVSAAIDLLKRETDYNLLGEAYMELQGYYDYNDVKALVDRIELVKLAVNSYSLAGNIQQKAASLQMLGDLSSISGASFAALQYLRESLDAYASIRYEKVQGIYCLMGLIYARLREYPRAMEYELLALKTAEATRDSSMQLCQIYNYLGEIQNAIEAKEKAIYYYDQALQVAEKHRDVTATYIAVVNIANTWAALNKPDKALAMMKEISSRYQKPKGWGLEYNIARCYITSYSSLKQFEKARPYTNQMLQMVESLNLNDNAKISAYTIAIRFFIAAGEVKQAKKYIEKHAEITNKIQDLYHKAANQKLRFMLDTSQHDYKLAVEHFIKFSTLNDSLAIQRKSRQLDELQVQFETEKKENALLVKNKDIQLLTKQSQLQQATIRQGRFTKNAMIAGAGLLLLVLILVYSRYVLKQKSNRQLQKQQDMINQQNLSLQALVKEQGKLLTEKEWLIKEIHHRVKNNLQIVMSLLNSQSAYIDNQAALSAIHDSQHRVHAMSLIHQKLYGSDNVSSIDMSIYIRELVTYLRDSFDTGQRIRFELDVEPIDLDVSQAVPLGLILNEAITNSIKYAFPDGRDGIISVSFSHINEDHCLLSVSDNGIGVPHDFLKQRAGSLGVSLMTGLSEDLDGNFSVENRNGAIIRVTFVHDLGIKRTDSKTVSFASNN